MDICNNCGIEMDWNDDSGFELIYPKCGNIQEGAY